MRIIRIIALILFVNLNLYSQRLCNSNDLVVKLIPGSELSVSQDNYYCNQEIEFDFDIKANVDSCLIKIGNNPGQWITTNGSGNYFDTGCNDLCPFEDAKIIAYKNGEPSCQIKFDIIVISDPWSLYMESVVFSKRICEGEVDTIKLKGIDKDLFRIEFDDGQYIQEGVYTFKPTNSSKKFTIRLLPNSNVLQHCSNEIWEQSFSYELISESLLRESIDTTGLSFSFCQNERISIPYFEDPDYNLIWYVDSLRQMGDSIEFRIFKDSTRLDLSIIDSSSKCSYIDSFFFNVENDLIPEFTLPDSNVCLDKGLVTYWFDNGDSDNYRWFWNSENENRLNYNYRFNNSGEKIINFRLEHLNSDCILKENFVLNVGELNVPIADDYEIGVCYNKTLELSDFYDVSYPQFDSLMIIYEGDEITRDHVFNFTSSSQAYFEIFDPVYGCIQKDTFHINYPDLTWEFSAIPDKACVGDSVELSVIGLQNSFEYSWTWNNSFDNIDKIKVPIELGDNNIDFKLTFNSYECEYDTVFNIEGGELPISYLLSSNELTTCDGDTLTLSDIYEISMIDPDDLIITYNNSPIEIENKFTFTEDETVVFEITDKTFGCVIRDTIEVSVPKLANLGINGIDISYCDSAVLSLTPAIINPNEYSYNWQVNGNDESSSQFFNFTFYDRSDVTLVVTENASGCEFSTDTVINVIRFDSDNVRILDSCGFGLKLLSISDEWEDISWNFDEFSGDYQIIPGFELDGNIIGIIQESEELNFRVEVTNDDCDFAYNSILTSDAFDSPPVLIEESIRVFNCDSTIRFIDTSVICDVIWYSVDPAQKDSFTITKVEGGRLIPDSLRNDLIDNIVFASCASCDTIFSMQVRSGQLEKDCYKLDALNVDIYPNPVGEFGYLNISVSGIENEKADLTLYNLAGQRLDATQYTVSPSPYEYFIGDIDPGFYFISVRINGLTSIHKIFIQ